MICIWHFHSRTYSWLLCSFNRKICIYREANPCFGELKHKHSTKYSNEYGPGVRGWASLKLTKHLRWTLRRGRLATVRKALKSCECCRRNIVNELRVSSLRYLPLITRATLYFIKNTSKILTQMSESHYSKNLKEYEHGYRCKKNYKSFTFVMNKINNNCRKFFLHFFLYEISHFSLNMT